MKTNEDMPLVCPGYATPADGGECLEPLPLEQVKLGGYLGQRVELTIHENLLKLDLEKDFLEPFRSRHSRECYVGLGKLMDSVVHFAQGTCAPELVAFKEKLFSAVAATQEANGYIGIMPDEKRIWEPFDLHDEAHIVSAFLEDYRCFGVVESLDVARRLMDLILREYHRMPKNAGLYATITRHMMGLGLEHALLNMYEATGERRYVDFCLEQCGMDHLCWPIQLERHRPLHGHSYMYLNIALAHLRLLKITGNPFHLRHPMQARDFMLHGGGTSIIGGVGISECWTNDQNGRGKHAETCSTAYQIRFFTKLLQMTGDSKYGDVVERMLFNALLAAQSPDGRRIRYWNPFEGRREYWPMDTYCCPNNYRRIMSELPGMLFMREQDGGGIAVCHYGVARAKMKLRGVQVGIEMETEYPLGEEIIIQVNPEKSVEFRLRLRIPLWCHAASVTVDGNAVTGAMAGRFLEITRVWKPGSKICLKLPMEVRFVAGHARQSGLYAVMRGPIVYTLNPINCGKNPGRQSGEGSFRAGDVNFVPDSRLEGVESADLTALRLDVESAAVMPDGAVAILADQDGDGIEVQRYVQLRLTPYVDPDGICSYFHLSKPECAVRDELFSCP